MLGESTLGAQNPTLEPMTNDQCSKFERKEMPFGKYHGKRIINVPLDYLIWLSEDEFQRDLKRYLSSPRIVSEQEESTD